MKKKILVPATRVNLAEVPTMDAPQTPAQAARLPGWPGRLAWLPIPLLLVAIVLLWVANPRGACESGSLQLALNFVGSMLAPCIIACLFARSFLVRANPGLLLLGFGAMAWGAAGGMRMAPGGQRDINLFITTHNFCVWLSAVCHLAGAVFLSLRPTRVVRHAGRWLTAACMLALGAVALVTLPALGRWFPLFFVQGQGGTPVRLIVLGSATVLFVLAAALLGALSRRESSRFFYWYALALALLAVGLFGIMIESVPAGPLSWTSRAARFLGGAYMLAAAMALGRQAGAERLTFAPGSSQARYRYAVAIAIVFAAAALRLAFLPMLGTHDAFITFYPAVMLAALYGGLGAGLAATLVSALFANYFWIEPVGQFDISSPADWLVMAVFLTSCAIVSWIAEAMHRAQARTREAEAKVKFPHDPEQVAQAVHASTERLGMERIKAVFPVNAAFGVALVMLVGVAWHAYRNTVNLAEVSRWEDHSYTVLRESDGILSTLKDAETGQRGFLMTGEEKYLEPYFRAIGRMSTAMASLKELLWDNPVQEQRLQELEPLVAEKLAELKRTIEVRRAEGFDPARAIVVSDLGRALMDDIRNRMSVLGAEEERLLQKRAKNKADDTHAMFQTGAVGGLLAVSVLVLAFWLLRREVVQRTRAEGQVRHQRDHLEELVTSRTAELAAEVADHKRAEEALRMSERRYSTLFANKINGMAHCRIITDGHGRPVDYITLQINEAYERIIGIKKADIEGRRVTDVFPEIRTYAVDYIGIYGMLALEGGEIQFEEFFEASGQHLSIYAYCPEPGEFIAILTDVSERKRAEATLRQLVAHNEFLARLVENAAQPVGVGYPDGRLGTINRAFEELTGYSAEELRSMDWAENLTPPEWREAEQAQLAKLVLTGQPVRYEKEYLRKNGTRVPIELLVHVIRDEAGQPECFSSFITDLTERKAAENALRQSEDRLRFALETCHIGAWDLDLVSHTAFRSLEHDRTFGHPELLPEWTYDMFLTHVLPDDRAAVDAKFQQSIATQSDWNFECRIRRADGEVRWIWASGRHRTDAAGGMRRMAGVVQDITVRKLAEETLKQYRDELETRVRERTAELWENQQRFTSMLEGVRDYAIIFLTPDGRVTSWNKGAQQIKGYQADEIVGEPFSRFYLPAEIAAGKPEQELRTTLVEGRYEEENWRVRKDGSRFWASVVMTALRDADGKVNGVVKITRDLTARKQAEAAMEESERAFRTLAESMPQMVWICQADGMNIYFNQRWVDYTGLTLEESYGRGWNTPFHPDDKQQAWDAWNAATATGATYQIECRLRRADGSYHWFITRGEPFRDSEGRILKWFGTCTDIDDLKRAETEIRSYAADLQRSNRELEHFAYVASHDLQEPLRTVGSFSELLANRYHGKLDDDADDFITFIVDGAKRMQNLINDLLAFSRIGTRGQPFTRVKSGEILQTARQNLEVSIAESGALITHDPLPVLVADQGQLTQLLQNLLGNAIKFRRPGVAPRIHVSATRQDDAWRLSVRDNGIGILPEYFERIFILFQRLHARDSYPGTGIGLAICMKIVERHGGRLWVESEPGSGSTFHFTIPDNHPIP